MSPLKEISIHILNCQLKIICIHIFRNLSTLRDFNFCVFILMQNTKKIFFATEKPKILFCSNTSNWKTFSENNITVSQVSICQTKVFGSLLSLQDVSPWAWRAQVWFDKDITRKSYKEHNCWCWRWPCHFNLVWIRFRKKQKQPSAGRPSRNVQHKIVQKT